MRSCTILNFIHPSESLDSPGKLVPAKGAPLSVMIRAGILLPGAFGEASLTLWLLIMGLNTQRWNEQADAAGRLRS